ncbi:MAG: putative urease accessory protein [Pseudomonadota bacterium]|jgi:urease accessory protein
MITPTITTTGMATRTEGDDSALLQLIWLASPALPVGGFSYSEGLEGAVDAGLITDEVSAARWLVDQLHLTLGRSDLAVVSQAVAAWRTGDTERVQALNDWVLNTRETRELRQQTEQMGRSFVEWLKSVHPDLVVTARPLGHLSYPVAFALSASASAAPVRSIVLAFAFGWAENMMQAAIKSVPLGQSAGQRILARLAHDIPQAVDHALTLDDASRQSFSPMLAILSSRHEHQYSRLFRS